MDTEPDFSIVTPSYNYARYVRECIESVKNQEGATFEHIIQDAGSTDGTLDILNSYPHLKLHVEKDSGMSEGINRGFRKARGKWVMWLNTDDRLLPGALAAVKAFADSRPDADIVHGAWNFIGPDGALQRPMKALPYSLNMHIWYGTYLASTALFLRRSTTIEEGFLLDERFRYDMDGEYYARLGRKKVCPLQQAAGGFPLARRQPERPQCGTPGHGRRIKTPETAQRRRRHQARLRLFLFQAELQQHPGRLHAGGLPHEKGLPLPDHSLGKVIRCSLSFPPPRSLRPVLPISGTPFLSTKALPGTAKAAAVLQPRPVTNRMEKG